MVVDRALPRMETTYNFLRNRLHRWHAVHHLGKAYHVNDIHAIAGIGIFRKNDVPDSTVQDLQREVDQYHLIINPRKEFSKNRTVTV